MNTHPAAASATAQKPLSSQVSEIAQSLRTSAADVTAIEATALRLAAAGNERAALGEQVSSAAESIATSVEETGAMAEKMARAQQSLSDLAQGYECPWSEVAIRKRFPHLFGGRSRLFPLSRLRISLGEIKEGFCSGFAR